jgi:hypothetical protein
VAVLAVESDEPDVPVALEPEPDAEPEPEPVMAVPLLVAIVEEVEVW